MPGRFIDGRMSREPDGLTRPGKTVVVHIESKMHRVGFSIAHCAFGAAHGGKPVAYRWPSIGELWGLCLQQRRSLTSSWTSPGKPKAYRHVSWQSHKASSTTGTGAIFFQKRTTPARQLDCYHPKPLLESTNKVPILIGRSKLALMALKSPENLIRKFLKKF